MGGGNGEGALGAAPATPQSCSREIGAVIEDIQSARVTPCEMHSQTPGYAPIGRRQTGLSMLTGDRRVLGRCGSVVRARVLQVVTPGGAQGVQTA